MKILIVDDSLERIKVFKEGNVNHNVYTANTVVDALFLLSTIKFDIVLLDHDLGNKSNAETGKEIVDIIIEKSLNKDANFIIHSLNPAGREIMYVKLHDSGFTVGKIPFGWMIKFNGNK